MIIKIFFNGFEFITTTVFMAVLPLFYYAIKNKWSSWKTLLNDKKALKAEVQSLNAKIMEMQQQIEQLKKIEDIIESREIVKP